MSRTLQTFLVISSLIFCSMCLMIFKRYVFHFCQSKTDEWKEEVLLSDNDSHHFVPFWLQKCGVGHWFDRKGQVMTRALSLYGYVVSFLSCCVSYDLGGRVGAALLRRGHSVEGFHRSLRRPGARHEDDWSSPPTSDLGGLCSSRSYTWAEHDSHSGLADRTGLSAGTEDSTYESRWQLGGLGRCGSLGTSITEPKGYKCYRNYDTTFDTYQGEEAEDDTGSGSRRRHGVHSGTGIHEGYLDSESGGTYRRLPTTRGGTHVRTAVSPVQEDSYARYGALCGLRGIRAFWFESPEGQQVQNLRAHGGWLCHKRTSRPSELHSMEGMLQGLHDGPFDAEHSGSSCTTCLRSLRGKAGEELSLSMAPHLRCGGQARNGQATRMRMMINMEIREGGTPPKGWEPTRPWNTVLRRLPGDSEYWREQVHNPALSWLAHGARGQPKTPIELYATGHLKEGLVAVQPAVEEGSVNVDTPKKNINRARREARKRRLASEREELERYRKRGPEEKGGKGKGGKGSGEKGQGQKCYGWNNGNGPCASLAPGQECASKVKRVHRCTICNSPGHPSRSCDQKGTWRSITRERRVWKVKNR